VDDGWLCDVTKSHGSWNYNWMHCVSDGNSSLENVIAADLKIFLN